MKFDWRRMASAWRSRLSRGWAKATGWIRMPRFLRRVPQWFRQLPHRFRQVPQALRWLGTKFQAVPRLLRRLPGQLRAGLLALVRLRPTPRLWTVLLALVAIPLGGFLIMAPARELATGRQFGLQTLLTGAWLVTGCATLAAGVGILFRAPSFRKLLILAFGCSLPLPAAFGYRTFTLAVKMRNAEPPVRDQLQPWVSGGLQLSLFFLAVSAFLFFMLTFRPLRTLQCNRPMLQGPAGPYLGPVVVGGIGGGAGYLTWLLFRWLGQQPGLDVFRQSVNVVRIEYYVGIGAVLGATMFLVTWWRRSRTRRPMVSTSAPNP